nr:hypothetical protein [Pseudomonadota bacterium]
MQRNKDTVYKVDPREYRQACAKFADIIEQRADQLLQRLQELNINECTFSELRNKIFALITHNHTLHKLISRMSNTEKDVLQKETIRLVKKMFANELIDQYRPLIKSALPHYMKSNLRVAIESFDVNQLSIDDVYFAVMEHCRQFPVIREAVSLLVGDECATGQALVTHTSALIEQAEHAQRLLATAAVVCDAVWLDGIKVTKNAEYADSLQALTSGLRKLGVEDEIMLEFLQEYLNDQCLLGVEQYHDAHLKKSLRELEKANTRSDVDAHLQYIPESATLILRVVRKYRTLCAKTSEKSAKKIERHTESTSRCYAQSVTTLHLTNRPRAHAMPLKVVNIRFANIQVDVVEGSLQIFDKATREYFIGVSASLLTRKIISGAIGYKNEDIIIDHVLSRFEGIVDEGELIKALIASRDPLAILLMARANASMLRNILRCEELLQCLCSDKYCQNLLKMLSVLYSEDADICADLAILIDCIQFIQSKDIADAETVKIIIGYLNNNQRYRYIKAALFSYQGKSEHIVELLKHDELFNLLDAASFKNLTLRYRRVASWLITKPPKQQLEEKLSTEQIVTILLRHPSLWGTVNKTGSYIRRLSAENLRTLAIKNNSEDSRKLALQAVFKDKVSMLPRLYEIEKEDPDAFLICCVEAETNFFEHHEEVKRTIMRALGNSKYEAISAYLRFVMKNFMPLCGKFIQEFEKSKLENSLAMEIWVGIISDKQQDAQSADFGFGSVDVLRAISQFVQLYPKLGTILHNEIARNCLNRCDERAIANSIFKIVLENIHLPCFGNTQFQVNAFKILRREEIDKLLFSPSSANLLLNFFSKDFSTIYI